MFLSSRQTDEPHGVCRLKTGPYGATSVLRQSYHVLSCPHLLTPCHSHRAVHCLSSYHWIFSQTVAGRMSLSCVLCGRTPSYVHTLWVFVLCVFLLLIWWVACTFPIVSLEMLALIFSGFVWMWKVWHLSCPFQRGLLGCRKKRRVEVSGNIS